MKRKIFFYLTIILLFFNFLQANEWKLSYKLDIPIIITSLGLDLSANLFKRDINGLSQNIIDNLDKNDIFILDRFAADLYDLNLKDASDYTVYANFLIPIGTSLFIDKENFFSDMIIYGEVMYLQSALVKWGKYLTKRNRPYTYNEEGKSRSQSREARFSFPSMHASTAFSAAVFASILYQQRGGKNPTMFWIANLSLATATGALRVASGNHFPTDVICGAIVGSAIGYLIPHLHKVQNENQRISLLFAGNYIGVNIKFD